MMTSDKKLAFLHKMAKLGMDAIPHYDQGGQVLGAVAGGATPLGVGGSAAGAVAGAQLPSAQGTGIAGIASNVLGTENTFQAAPAQIASGTNAGQIEGAYNNTQAALGNQNYLAGLGSSTMGQALNTQNGLANQLSLQAQGQGPNPAQAALNQSTGQNINAQAALMASQRGAGANAGATAENAARIGSGVQQQAVGQAATLQAQQQIAAQQQQAQLAAQQYAETQGAIQANTVAQQNEQGILQNANQGYNNALTSGVGSANAANAQVAAGNQQAHSNMLGGLLSGASAALGGLFAHGGEVHPMAEGGYMAPAPLVVQPEAIVTPMSAVGQYLNPQASAAPAMVAPMGAPEQAGYSKQAGKLGETIGGMGGGGGGMEQTMAGGMDASEISAMPTMMAAKGGVAKKPLPMMGKNEALIARGGKVKADGKDQKAVSGKDDYANDKVPALLSEGEVVIDLDTLNDKGPLGQMARQVAHHISMRNASRGKKHV